MPRFSLPTVEFSTGSCESLAHREDKRNLTKNATNNMQHLSINEIMYSFTRKLTMLKYPCWMSKSNWWQIFVFIHAHLKVVVARQHSDGFVKFSIAQDIRRYLWHIGHRLQTGYQILSHNKANCDIKECKHPRCVATVCGLIIYNEVLSTAVF